MRFVLIGLAGIAGAFTGSDAGAAGFFTGNELLEACSATNGTTAYEYKSGICSGYVLGIADELDLENAQLGRGSCFSDEVTLGQLRDVVLKYLQEHPEHRDLDAAVLVRSAFASAYPACRP